MPGVLGQGIENWVNLSWFWIKYGVETDDVLIERRVELINLWQVVRDAVNWLIQNRKSQESDILKCKAEILE